MFRLNGLPRSTTHVGPVRTRSTRRAAAALFAAMLLAQIVPIGAVAKDHVRSLTIRSEPLSDVLVGGLASIASHPGSIGQRRAVVTRTVGRATEIAVSVLVDESARAGVAAAIRAFGGHVANEATGLIEAYVEAGALRTLATASGVRRVAPIWKSLVAAAAPGVVLHGADAWQVAGINGAGVKVGILDLGFAGLQALLGHQLPASVQVMCFTSVGVSSSSVADCENSEKHGTAVAETVTSMAPGAALYLADPMSFLDTQNAVAWMTSQGVTIINASTSSGVLFEGPGDGTSPYSNSTYRSVDAATAAGALWINSAGNDGYGGWRGPWSDTDANGFLEFAPGDENQTLTLGAGETITAAIRWSEPWGSATARVGVAIYPHLGLDALAVGDPIAPGAPGSVLQYTSQGGGNYDISVKWLSGPIPSSVQLLVNGGGPISHPVAAGTLPAPADSANPLEVTVGAVNIAKPSVVETFSSRGPTTDGRIKPDLVAGDCGATATSSQFCGTSQSAPFVAGAAALVLAANPTFSGAQIKSFLQSHAAPLGSSIPNATYGWGRLSLGPAPSTAPSAAGPEFQTQPVGGPASAPFTVQPVVRIVDSSQKPVTTGPGSTAPVTLAIGSNPGGGVLACSSGLTISAVAGVAAFQGCTVSAPGIGYALTASSPGLSPTTSAPFTVTTAQSFSLRFATQPGGAAPNVPFEAQPVIQVLDIGGAVVTSGPASITAVTLAMGANPGGAVLACTSGLTVAAVAGVATFSGCQLSAPGAGYTIVATAASAKPATSTPFGVGTVTGGAAAPALALAPSSAAVGWGEAVTFTVRLAPASGGGTVAGRGVQLEASRDRLAWGAVSIQTTDAFGDASFSYRPSDNRYYRATFPGAPDLGAAMSNVERVVVRQIAIMRPTNNGSVKRIARGTRITFTTMVRPARQDLPQGHVTYEVWKKDGSIWTFFLTQTLAVDTSGKASLAVTFSTAGSYYVRSFATPTTFNANSGWSPPERYDVR